MSADAQQPQQPPQPQQQQPPQPQVSPQIVYQQKPFPWLGLSQALILVLILVILRKEFMGAVVEQSQSPAAPAVQAEIPTSGSLQIVANELTDLRNQLVTLKREQRAAVEAAAQERREFKAGLNNELQSLLKKISATASAQKKRVGDTVTLQKQVQTLQTAQAEIKNTLEKLRVRVLARAGLSPTTEGKAVSTKNRLSGYVADEKKAQPVTTPKTPRVVRSQKSEDVVGSVGEPPIPDFASKWKKQWRSEVAADKDNLKRRAFIYKMLSHPQSRQGMEVYVEALDDSDPVVRNFAVKALRDTTGKNFGYSASAPREQRLQGIKAWKAEVVK